MMSGAVMSCTLKMRMKKLGDRPFSGLDTQDEDEKGSVTVRFQVWRMADARERRAQAEAWIAQGRPE
jgi:hypothetical protein